MLAHGSDLRVRIINAYEGNEGSIRELAERFVVSPNTVYRYLKQWRESRAVAPKPRRNGPQALIPDEHLDRVRAIVAMQNEQTLEWYCKKYEELWSVRVSIHTMARALKRTRISRKKKTLKASEQDTPGAKKQRRAFLRHAYQLRQHRFIFVDEFGVNRANGPRYARSVRGRRARGKEPKNPDPNITVVVGLDSKGPVAPLAFEGPMNQVTFDSYIATCLCPELRNGDVVIVDQLGAHRGHKARDLVEKRGAQFLLLPPYSPDLSPVEEEGSKIKAIARYLPHNTAAEIIEGIGVGLRSITPKDAEGWFHDRAKYLYTT